MYLCANEIRGGHQVTKFAHGNLDRWENFVTPIGSGLAIINRMFKNYYTWPTALKFDSKCSYITHKLRFFAGFCLVLPALMTFFNSLAKFFLEDASSGL